MKDFFYKLKMDLIIQFLRDDFYFAGYLNLALSNTIKKIYQLKISCLFSIFVIYAIGKILERPTIAKMVKIL